MADRIPIGGTDQSYVADASGNAKPGTVLDVRDLDTGQLITDLQPGTPTYTYDGQPFPAGQARADRYGYYGFTVPPGTGTVQVRTAASGNTPAGVWFTVAGQSVPHTVIDAGIDRAAQQGRVLTPAAASATYVPLPEAQKNALTGWFHTDGFGAVGDGAADDTAAIQAAIDAADAAGGGRVYLRKGTYKVTGLLLPSKVTLVGDSAGGQVGNSTKIIYAGAAGGTLIGPKVRTSDTINWKIEGLDLDGGGLAGVVVEFYRVSYSRMLDCAVYGGQADTGVGVLFDANVNNQCYFNVADNVKVDGLPTGIRFQRGANVNRWQGGKIGNGGTGMEFLSLSAGNIVIATDLETATVKHILVDAPSNVFVGLHMEVAPIGFDITANGNGTRRFGTTFATNVETWVQTAASQAGTLDELTPDTYGLQLGATKVSSKTLSTSTTVNVDPVPFSGTASSVLSLFRNVNTTGICQVLIHRGNGAANTSLYLDLTKRNILIGDNQVTSLADGQGVIGIGNALVAPTTNPASGGLLYVEGGTLKFRSSAGDVFSTAKQAAIASPAADAASLKAAVDAIRTVLQTAGLTA